MAKPPTTQVWLTRAQQARDLLEQMSSQQARHNLQRLAEKYEILARLEEERNQPRRDCGTRG